MICVAAVARWWLATEPPAAVAAARFIALTGFRRGEALALRRNEVDLGRQTATLAETKTGRSIRPLSRTACDVLSKLARTGELVVPASRGEGRTTGFPKFWTRIAKLGALPDDVTPHVLRHSFASVAADLGYSELTIARPARPQEGERHLAILQGDSHFLKQNETYRGLGDLAERGRRALGAIPARKGRDKYFWRKIGATPQQSCALIVSILWDLVHSTFQPNTKREAKEACDALWGAAGGPIERAGQVVGRWGDRESKAVWRDHLREAKKRTS